MSLIYSITFQRILLFLYLVFVFFLLLFINLYYLEGIPHVPDSAAYLFMAKILATGHFILPIPVSAEHFDFFPGILSIENGTWFFQYPIGHPLLLTFGVLLGFPNIIPPLIGVLNILFIFLIAKSIFDKKTAVFSLLLPVLSPFFITNASSFMSHNSALFYLLLSLFTLIQFLKKGHIFFPFLSGLFLGLLFNTRPLTCLPFLFLLFLILIYKAKNKLQGSMSFAIGFLLLLLFWLFYNYITTGSSITSQYYTINQGHLSFSLNETIIEALQKRIDNTTMLFNNWGPMLFNWPIFITYSLFFIPFFSRKTTAWDIVSFAALFGLPFVYFFYNGTFIMYGPRFWYESLPFVIFLVSRSITILFNFRPKLTIAVFIVLSGIAWFRFLGIIPTTNPDFFSPLKLPDLKGFNFVDARIINKIKDNNIHNAIVFVEDCQGNWWCYGSVFSQNNPTLTTDIIYAKDLGYEKNRELINNFPEKKIYIINYDKLDLKQ